MSFSLKVTNTTNNTIWEKKLSVSEYQTILTSLDGGAEGRSLKFGLVRPIRTNNLKNFAKDLFSPTLFNYALKIESIVKRIFCSLGALVLDTMTFPVRLIMCIPRMIDNARQEENPIKKYLSTQKVDAALLKSDHLHVRLESEEVSEYPVSSWMDEDGTIHSIYEHEIRWAAKHINFIEVPLNLYKGCGAPTVSGISSSAT